PPGPRRPAGRHRPRGRVPRLGREQLHHRDRAVRRWWAGASVTRSAINAEQLPSQHPVDLDEQLPGPRRDDGRARYTRSSFSAESMSPGPNQPTLGGSPTANVAPRPGPALSALIVPPWASTMYPPKRTRPRPGTCDEGGVSLGDCLGSPSPRV